METIKISIQKYKVIGINWKRGAGDWGRYYPCENVQFTIGYDFTTEADLCYYLYRRFGEGRYKVIAWKKNHEGFFLYWLGNVYNNGFLRDRTQNKEMDRLKKELAKAKDHDDRQMVEEEIDFEKELHQEEKKGKVPICYGLVKYQANIMHSYDELPPAKRRI